MAWFWKPDLSWAKVFELLIDSDKHFTAQQGEGKKKSRKKKINYPLYVHLLTSEFLEVPAVVCKMVSTSETWSDGPSQFPPTHIKFFYQASLLKMPLELCPFPSSQTVSTQSKLHHLINSFAFPYNKNQVVESSVLFQNSCLVTSQKQRKDWNKSDPEDHMLS